MIVHYAILTHNRVNSLIKLIESIFRQDHDNVEYTITIFDNDSNEECRRIFFASPYSSHSKLFYIISPENTFMAGKYHIEKHILGCYKKDNETFIAHLDDDVVLSPVWLQKTLSSCVESGWHACGSVEIIENTLTYSGQKQLLIDSVCVNNNTIKIWKWEIEKLSKHERSSEVAFAGHRAILVRIEANEQVLHDPKMLIGGEDIDFSLSLRKKGFKIGIHHDAFITHRNFGEQDASDFRIPSRILMSWEHFFRKWGFVRNNVYRELNISETKWLEIVSAWIN